MAKVEFLANIYGAGKVGEVKEISDSDVLRFGDDVKVLEAPKTKNVKNNRKVSNKTIKTK